MTNALELHAIVLAAGTGSRFGGRKLLAPWNDGVLLDGALAAAIVAPVSGIVVVTGADADDVAAAAQRFATDRGENRLTIVHAPDFAEGMAASLRTGISHLPPSAGGAFIFLGDMPRIPPAILAPLAEVLRRGAPAAAPLCSGQRGHPVLVSRALFPELANLRGDKGARGVLDALGPALALVPTTDNGVLFDVDEPSDLA